MTKVTNETGGPRAVHTLAGEVFFDKGESKNVTFAPGGITAARMIGLDVDGDEVEAPTGSDVLADLLARAEKAERERDAAYAKMTAMDAPAASLPALTGKNKADLLEIAKAEGVEIEDSATNDDIRSAIELHREG